MSNPQSSSQLHPHNSLKGFLLATMGLLLFACMDSTIKYLAARHNVPFLVAMRYLTHFLLMVLVLAPSHGMKLIQTQRTSLVIIRGSCLAVVSLLVGLALQRMPLAETTAINFLAPMLVVVLANPILGERISPQGWMAAIGGFVGVLLIVRPGGGLDTVGVIFALLAVGANTAYQMLSRLLASTEQTVTLLFYTALIGSLVFGLGLPWFWEHRSPTHLELFLIFSMGCTGGLGHYLFTLAYRYAHASIIAPTMYLQLLWAGLLGWLIFGTTPDGLSILGMAIVAASGLLLTFKRKNV